MPTPFESATLILDLYEKRRDPLMREARNYFTSQFDPQSFEEFQTALIGPNSAFIRMVMSYWDMAASFVNNGAIDGKMFLDANGEFVLVFGRIEPFLPQMREMFGNPGFAANLEKFALSMPNARQRIDGTVARMRRILAQRAATMSETA